MPDQPHIQQALARARDALDRNAATALHEDAAALAVWKGGLATALVHTAVPGLRTDMPPVFGGTGAAPSPGWYFRAGVAACLATCIAMEAAQRGIALARLEVQAHSESDARGMLGEPGVVAGPQRFWLNVMVEAPDVPEATLRELVATADAHSPLPNAVRRALDVAIDLRLPAAAAAT